MEVAGGEGVVDLGGGDSPVVAELDQVDESVAKHNRNPRWLQEETLVLVEAKRRQAEELLVSIPRSRNLTADERWEAIASYCNVNNCDRNAYQCRKRWFALSGDYNKVREWQRSNSESYWIMKTDRRRENRLPGAFDQLVFSKMHSWMKKDSDASFDSPASRPDEGLSSEIEQDAEGQDLPDNIRGEGTSIPRSDQAGDSGDKRYRNPRWSLHESLILLAAKKKQEDDFGMVPKASVRTTSADERWETISAYCRTQGCDRNAYQCRKRWSALLGDFKRIRDWQKISRETYWLMKNEKRKENKLPAIFDHELFANMETWVGKRWGKKSDAGPDGLVDCSPPANGGLLSDVDHVQDGHMEPDSPMGGCQRNTILPPEFGKNLRQEMPSDSTARKKRKRSVNGDTTSDYKGQQLAAVFKSSVKAMQAALAENTQIQIRAHQKAIQAQIEAHNLNSELDRIQRKEQGESLVGVLGKLAEAWGKIAEKLL
ncbi:unnamed protein product [Calypogeia fissa]